jgi:hypothetical protein
VRRGDPIRVQARRDRGCAPPSRSLREETGTHGLGHRRFRPIPKLYSWGDLTDEDYRREMAETRTMLAELPDPNKLLAFDRNRHVMVTMAENVDRATRP